MNIGRLPIRGLFACAAAAAMLSACSGGAGTSAVPQGLTPAARSQAPASSSSATAQSLTAMHHDGDDNDGGGKGGGTTTFTLGAYVGGLRADSLNFIGDSKTCDATLADAPTYTSASFKVVTLTAPIVLSDCNRANVGVTQSTNDYIVLVDESKNNAVTAIAGPAAEVTGTWTFPLLVTSLPLVSTDTYAFMVATGTLTTSGGSCSGDDNDHHRHGDVKSAKDHDGDHHDCHGDGDGGDHHDGDHDGGDHDGGDHGH